MRRLLDRLILRVRSLFRGSRADASLQRELQHHLDELTAEFAAGGMTDAEARAAARRAFGSSALIADECRDTRRVSIVHNLIRDIGYARRSLLHEPLLVIVASLSIGVAVAANAVIYGLGAELLVAAPTARDVDRLAYIRSARGSHVSYPVWRDLQDSGALAGLAGYQIEIEVNWSRPDGAVSLLPLVVTPNFFDVVGVPVAIGRGFTSDEAQPGKPGVVVISHAFWRTRLGADPAAIGRTLIFNGAPHTVIGILPENLRAVPGFGITPDVYLPLSSYVLPQLDVRNAAAVMLIGRLRDDQTFAQGRAALDAAARRIDAAALRPELGGISQFRPANALRRTGEADQLAIFFAVLSVAVGVVLAIACANVAGLLLSRTASRRREMALRAALGASRRRLVQQLLAEAGWLALFGTLTGLALAQLASSLIAHIRLPVPIPIVLRAPIDARLLLVALVLMAVTTMLAGMPAALQAASSRLLPGLKIDEPRYGRRRWTLRALLVTAQMAVTLVLLLTALLFLRNLGRAHDVNPGFDTARTLVAEVSFVEGRYTAASRAVFLEDAVRRLSALSGVRVATFARGVPLTLRSGSTTGTDLVWADTGEQFRSQYQANSVGPAYFSTMGIRLIKGREFSASDGPGSAVVIIVNEEFVNRHGGGRDPIGRHIMLPGPDERRYPAEIIGVAANSRHRSIGEQQQPAIYESFMQRANRGRFVHILAGTYGDAELLAHDVEQTLSSMDPTAAVQVTPMRSALAFAFLPSQMGAVILGTLGLLGLVLAMVGLFATVAFSVSRRTAEIGVRMALGASGASVLRLVVGDAAWLAGLGITIGLAVSVLVTRPLAQFLVAGLSPGDPLTFIAAALLLLVVSLVAAIAPATRAMRIDPVTALRRE
jgi:predicted permease